MMITCPFFTVSPTFTLISRITPGSGDFTPDLPVEAAAGFTTGVAGAAGADVAAGRATGLTTTFGAFPFQLCREYRSLLHERCCLQYLQWQLYIRYR